MQTITDRPVREDFVNVALKVDDHSTNYRIEFAPPEAELFLTRSPEYNNMERMGQFVKAVNDVTPRCYYNEGNPNNGGFIHNFLIGNESSRVVYVSLNPSGMKAGKSPEELQKALNQWVSKVEGIGKRHGADEAWLDEAESGTFRVVVRIWWD